METGSVVEYIDRQKIIIAVVMEAKGDRIRLLNDANREVKLSASRILHKSRQRLSGSVSRDRQIEALKEIACRRRELADQINIRELWEVLNSEQQRIDLKTMTELCFPFGESPSEDCESAVLRTFFNDKLYFRFSPDGFFPNTEEQVRQLQIQAEEAERKNRLIELGGLWLKSAMSGNGHVRPPALTPEEQAEITEILKSLYLYEKDSRHYAIGKEITDKAGITDSDILFQILVRLNIWNKNENIDLYRYEVPIDFSEDATREATNLICRDYSPLEEKVRKDLTHLPLITIDGQSTMDFDDALSIEEKEDHYQLGVHIADVGHCVRKGCPIDTEAILRGSSIYMPDMKIPMLPTSLAEDLCSLKAGEIRPGISVMVKIDKNSGAILHYDIFPSIIQVKKQLTYYEVNTMSEENRDIFILHEIATKFRHKRLRDGAVHISLPEINIWLTDEGELMVSKTNRESPGRMLVSEMMIMANWLMARFLSERNLPAIFRSQPDPKERLYHEDQGTLFQNWMQRRLLSRFVLSSRSERHSGLGLDAYLTATSPIRKYFDLVTQRQIRSAFDLDTPYTSREIEQSLHSLEQPMFSVSRLQYQRKRYWLLKYLEERVGKKEEALVLNRRRNGYQVLLTEYLTECILPVSSGVSLRSEDTIQVTIQHVNARKDTLSVYMA
jgi:exoribonuclease-2